MSNQYPNRFDNFTFLEFLSQITGCQVSGMTIEEVADDNTLQEELLEKYQQYQEVDFFDLTAEKITIELEDQLPEKNAHELKAIVLGKTNSGYKIGFANPFDKEKVSTVESLLNAYIEPVMVREEDLTRFLRLTFRKVEAIQNFAKQISVEHTSKHVELYNADKDNRVAELVNLIIRDAYEINASDVHIETGQDQLQVRVRIDGTLQQYQLENIAIKDYIVRYLKLLSDIDITQETIPSDGRKVSVWFDGKEINLRIAFLPTYFGQSVVIRLLGESSSYRLSDKISDAEYLGAIQDYLSKTYGMFVISGPTGSGKTTTLYSAIASINESSRKIITLEDPVEAKMPGLNQVQINEAINYGFAEGVRAAMRQDPDVIMVGEIRDENTAIMAVRAAITGHMVLASIHTRGVIEIPIRLLNLNVDPFLLATALRLNISQRLIKEICPNCKETKTLDPKEQLFMQKEFPESASNSEFSHGAGCHYCQHSGYAGRVAIFEMLHLTQEMIGLLAQNDIGAYIELASKAIKGKTLMANALALAKKGVTTIEEVMRVNSD